MKIVVILLLLILSACQSPNTKLKEADQELNIITTSDIHYLSNSLQEGDLILDFMERSDGKNTIYVDTISDVFVQEAIDSATDYVIITGDLTYNGEKKSHQDLIKKLKKLKNNNIQVLVIPGNHDILNSKAFDFSSDELKTTDFITNDEFKELYADYGYKKALYSDTNTLSYVYELSKGAWALMLDTNQWENNTCFAPESDGSIEDEQLVWIENILKEAQEKNIQVLSFTHHNLIQQTNSDQYRITNYYDLEKLYDKYNVQINMSGHIHAQAYKTKQLENITINDIASSSLDVYDHQYGVIKFKPFAYFNYHTQNLDVETYANNHKIKDESLLNFNEYSKEFFKIYSIKRLENHYVDPSITLETAKEIELAKGEMNTYVFKGEMLQFNAYFKNTDLYQTILTLPKDLKDSFTAQMAYLNNDPNNIEITFQ